jgi:Predicted ATPase with chaperone activity
LLKVARTLADLEQAASISRQHLAEALQYRPGSQA